MSEFDYDRAFSRNIGWLTRAEQQQLRQTRVAIAGLGGVGGSHLLTLARLGVGAFSLADYDTFELANFNRQAGARTSTLNRPKLEVLQSEALDINPGLDVRGFSAGVTQDNLDAFLEDVDIYVDGLDFFAFDIRQAVFEACWQRGIPAVTAAPLGMGVALLNFLPGKMRFADYFAFSAGGPGEKPLRFMLGLAPARLQMRYLVDPSSVKLDQHRGPSTPMACELCAGVAATQVLKIVLKRGKIVCAPRGLHFDAYLGELRHTWLPAGNRNPLARLALALAKRKLASENKSSSSLHTR